MGKYHKPVALILLPFLLTLSLSLILFVLGIPATAYADDTTTGQEEYDITVDGPAVTCGTGEYRLFFTASSDSGYTVTIDAPDYMITDVYFYGEDPEYGGYSWLNNDILLNTIYPGTYTGANCRRISSFYGQAGWNYQVYLRCSYVDDFTSGTAKVTVRKTDKAGITSNGFEYWSDNSRGEEFATIMDYKGDSSDVTVPGEVGGLQVITVGNDFMKNNTTVRRLVFSEGIQIFRNNIAAECSELREVVLPSTLQEHSNTIKRLYFPYIVCY